MVDGETYGCVKRFCYLVDTLDRDSEVDLADTAGIRNIYIIFLEGRILFR